jgi:phytoene dehydrogenase-like protein
VSEFDAIVIGSGPNGFAAAITLAKAGVKTLVVEGSAQLGGGVKTEELTLPGFHHDTCSTVHPMAIGSEFFQANPITEFGLEWLHPASPLAHPLDNGGAAMLENSVEKTADSLGADARAYIKLMSYYAQNAEALFEDALKIPHHIPRHPWLLARFGLQAMRSADSLARSHFSGEAARGLLAGLAGHSFLPLTQTPSAAITLMLAIAAHGRGWPVPRGGAGAMTRALLAYFKSLGGSVQVGEYVDDVRKLPRTKFLFFDLVPHGILKIAGAQLPATYRASLERYRMGSGIFKIDFALSDPIPWTAPECRRAGTVHLGNTLEEISASELAHSRDEYCEKPFVLLTQPSVFDSSRAPPGKHIAWAYCHVPRASTRDMTREIESQIERYAPGFRQTILAKYISTPQLVEAKNPNYVGGDISGGLADFKQLFARPVLSFNPYTMPVKGWYICSAATPPGAGVHGMCGYLAAQAALKTL